MLSPSRPTVDCRSLNPETSTLSNIRAIVALGKDKKKEGIYNG